MERIICEIVLLKRCDCFLRKRFEKFRNWPRRQTGKIYLIIILPNWILIVVLLSFKPLFVTHFRGKKIKIYIFYVHCTVYVQCTVMYDV